MIKSNTIIFIMGVSGSGKTVTGRSLSSKMDIPFFDADDFHPPANKDKMRNGIALTDDDRVDWLSALNRLAIQESQIKGAIIACSALKQKYRDLLIDHVHARVHWVYLQGNYDLIENRMKSRKDHYMPPGLLKSQFDILEPPTDALIINIDYPVESNVESIINTLQMNTDFGLIGLGVMGKSLARNLASKGFKLSLYNRFIAQKEEKIAELFIHQYSELSESKGFEDLIPFILSLKKPRKIFLMIQAGYGIDEIIKNLIPHLQVGDIIMDGGNSNYKDTERRIKLCIDQGIHFMGVGVSGGEEGALKGPSIMPGGSLSAYNEIKQFLESISARDKNGLPCCTYIGSGGSGHFVKMIHNGIEYAEMQLLGEVYILLRKGMSKNPDEIADLFSEWNKGELNSYLLEITIQILRKKDGESWLIDKILDKGSGKGTGGWATIAATELNIPAGMISEALFARYLSSLTDQRKIAQSIYRSSENKATIQKEDIQKAYRLARIINHHQGFSLLDQASKDYSWGLNLSELARIWTNGCIIRSKLMGILSADFLELSAILLNPSICDRITADISSFAKTISEAALSGIQIPCLSSAINYFYAYTQTNDSISLIQAQRDFFGAHTYQLKDDESGKSYHTEW